VTNISDVGNEIVKELERYSREVQEEINAAKDAVSKDLVKELKQKSPHKTGDYQKGWRIKKGKKTNIVHNKEYQLTHLLEHGHAKRNGGRVGAKIHIAPAEQQAVREFLNRVEQAIK
jgi:hypothetical protein